MAVELGDRFWSKVNKDTDNGCWEWTAGVFNAGRGYGQYYYSPTRRTAYAHRLSWEAVNGTVPDGLVIDHVCWNRVCVNPEHMRLATKKANAQNLSGARINNATGVRGVRWDQDRSKYHARVCLDRKTVHLGRFQSLGEAEAAVTEYRRKHMPDSLMDKAG